MQLIEENGGICTGQLKFPATLLPCNNQGNAQYGWSGIIRNISRTPLYQLDKLLQALWGDHDVGNSIFIVGMEQLMSFQHLQRFGNYAHTE